MEAFETQFASLLPQMRLVFDSFEIDQDGPRLMRDGKEVSLERRTLDLLCYLAAHPGRLVRKDELLSHVWNAQVLSDGVLSNTIAKLRKALGQGARDRLPIETVHGRGYRFHGVGELQPPLAAADASAALRVDPLVGRDAALRTLTSCLDRTEAGSGDLVLITGDAGIGKSRMLAELTQRARARGWSVWQGVAYAGGAAPAYWPWVEIIRAALTDGSLSNHLPRDSWAIAMLVPEKLEPASVAEDSHALRFRLFDELARTFSAAAADQPRLIALEDLHWADSASIELLAYLARGLERQRVLLVAAARDRELAVDLEAAESNARSGSVSGLLRAARLVELPELSQAEVANLARELGATDLDAPTLELLYARTQGNPFFVRQVMQLLEQRGLPLSTAALDACELPRAVRDVIQQRLSTLAADTRSLLKAAAVVGQQFEAGLVASISEVPLEAVLLALEPAVQLGLVRAQDATPHRFEFNHALVRDSLYAELGLASRGGLHAHLVRALSAHASESDSRRLGEIARHSLLAVPSELDACVDHCLRAAAAARNASGFEAAAAFLVRALDKLAAEGGDRERRCELLYQLGLDRLCHGEVDAGWRALEDGARLAAEIGSDAWLSRIATRLASWMEVGGNAIDLATLVEDALARATQDDLRARLLARRAALGMLVPRETREAWFAEAEALAARSGVPEALIDVAISRFSQRDPAHLSEARAAIATYRALDSRYGKTLHGVQQRMRRVLAELADYWCALVEGDLVTAELLQVQCELAADACRVPQLRRLVDLLVVTRALADHRLDDAAQCIERMQGQGPVGGGLNHVGVFCSLMLSEARGELDLQGLVQRGDVSIIDRLAPAHRIGSCAWTAAFFARSGHAAVARMVLGWLSTEERDHMQLNYGGLGAMCALAETYCELGDTSEAERLYEQLLPFAALNAVGTAFDYKGSVAHYLGMLALLLDRRSAANEHLTAALAFNRKLGMKAQVEKTTELLARARA